LVCLFGCGGNRDKDKREKMGKIAAKLCDFAILTSDNPRYEDPLDIIDQIERGYRAISNRYVVVPDREKALDYALDCLSKEDILLVAGKGGEDYQEIMGIKYPFNDQDMVIKLMCKKGKI
jgi:UDP-N-acetylmuramoyl-L-alanyl-D-glutamate--2,6-diaminopimelate ligase